MPELKPISKNNKATGLSKQEEFMEVILTKCGNIETINGYLEDGDVEPLWNWILKECVFKDDVHDSLDVISLKEYSNDDKYA